MLYSIGLVVALTLAYYLAPWDGGRPWTVAVRIVFAMVVIVAAVGLGVRYIDRGKYPMLRMFETLAGIVSFTVVAFASIYVMMSNADPMAFSEPLGHTDALYFTMTTITTVGFGDISPKTDGARIVVMLQMVVNVLVLGVAARTLVRSARRAGT